LCERIIVIDRGRLRYDGGLQALVRSIRPHKRIALRYDTPPDRAALERVGAVVELGPTRAVVQAPQEDVREAVSHLLTHAAVTDLTIEDPPLEEVMRELFTHK